MMLHGLGDCTERLHCGCLDDRTYVGETVYGVQVIEHTHPRRRPLILAVLAGLVLGVLLAWGVAAATADPAPPEVSRSFEVTRKFENASATPGYVLWVRDASTGAELPIATYADLYESTAVGDVITVG